MDTQTHLKKKRIKRRMSVPWIRAIVVWAGGLVLSRLMVRWLATKGWVIFQDFWPLTVVWPKYGQWYDLLTVGAMIAGIWWFVSVYQRIRMAMFIGMIGGLSLLSTLLQGIYPGFVYPITGMNRWDATYWHASEQITRLSDYLATYVWQQPMMNYHTRVHPPGPTVIIWFLRLLWNQPLMVGAVFWGIGLVSVWLIYRMVSQQTNRQTGRLVAALWGVSPFFQIYAWLSFDMVIATVFLAVVYLWLQAEKQTDMWLAVFGLYIAALCTFGVVWLVLLLALMDLMHKRGLTRWLRLVGLTGGLLVITNWLWGYDYLKSFQVASHFEGLMNGSMIVAAPLAYVVSRLQGVLEPLVYLGPIGSYLLWRVTRLRSGNVLVRVAQAGLISMGVFLLSGAYYSGETARAALYVIPVILVGWTPLLLLWEERAQNRLIYLWFGQGILMQMLLFFHW